MNSPPVTDEAFQQFFEAAAGYVEQGRQLGVTQGIAECQEKVITLLIDAGWPIQRTPQEIFKSKTALSDISVDSLHKSNKLSTRCRDILRRAHIDTVWDLVRKTEDDLLALNGLGPKYLKEVVEALDELDQQLLG